MLRNFEKFEVGHYYVYTGGKEEGNWNPYGAMYFAIKHEILQCSNNFKHNHASADFKGYESGTINGWDWSDGFDNWVEVESPDAVFVEGDSVLEYKRQHESWYILALVKCQLTEDEKENGYDNGNSVYYVLKRKTKENKEILTIKNNPFKKYIRKKKYLTFSKKKKHTK